MQCGVGNRRHSLHSQKRADNCSCDAAGTANSSAVKVVIAEAARSEPGDSSYLINFRYSSFVKPTSLNVFKRRPLPTSSPGCMGSADASIYKFLIPLMVR